MHHHHHHHHLHHLHNRPHFFSAAKEANVNHFSIVTSVGADKDSLFLYPSTKGLIEEDIKKLNFPQFSIFRPSFLEGKKRKKERERKKERKKERK